MKELIDKLSSYNIFNYLLPGMLFVGLSKYITGYDLVQENILVGVFVYYFLGMVISRIGSLVIEPLLKKLKVIRFVDYADYVAAAKKDEKIELLSEINNTYRTLTAMALLLLLLRAYHYWESYSRLSADTSAYILTVLLVLIFLFSHRKQTSFVRRRIELAKAEKPNTKKENE